MDYEIDYIQFIVSYDLQHILFTSIGSNYIVCLMLIAQGQLEFFHHILFILQTNEMHMKIYFHTTKNDRL